MGKQVGLKRGHNNRNGYRDLALALFTDAAVAHDLGWYRSADCSLLLDLAGLPADAGRQMLRGARFRKLGLRCARDKGEWE